jgi:branched-chain amino acid transport system permease protein
MWAKAGTSPSTKVLLLTALVVCLYAFPFVFTSDYRLFVATQTCIYILIGIALNFLAGFGGQVSLGHGALVAIGAYTAALLMVDYHWSFWPAALLAMISATTVGALMALPSFRLSTWYFALITLGFAQVVESVLVEWQGVTHGFAGVLNIPAPSLFGHDFTSTNLYWLALSLVVLAMIGTANLLSSRFGRGLIAVRDVRPAAFASGVSAIRIKMFAFSISAALTGLGGALFAVQQSVITPDDFPPDFSIFFLLLVVLGGSGTQWGPVLGAVVFFVVPELLTSLQSWRMLVYGVGLLVLVLYAPHGLVGALETAWLRLGVRLGPAHRRPRSAITASTVAGAALNIEEVVKRFGGVTALDDVSLRIGAGASHAIVGPNGSGKTTLLNMISGFYGMSAGRILIDGEPIAGMAPHDVARLGVGRTFQTPKLMPDLSVLDNVLLGAFPAERYGALSAALRLPATRRRQDAFTADAIHNLEFVGLAERAGHKAGDLPHGQQRLTEIARAMVGRPRLLLLDEPAAGLSLSELDALRELIAAIGKLGTTIVIVEHHLELVADICSSVTVLERGRVLASGTPQAVFSDAAVVSAYMGSKIRLEFAR